MESVYIFNVQPLLIDNAIVWDIFYLKESNTKIHCIRVFNIELSFLIARLPRLHNWQFAQYMKLKLPDATIKYRNDLKESEFFYFGRNRLYAEVFSNNPITLKQNVKTLHDELKSYYKRLDVSKLTPKDANFYKNSETPFRFTATTTSLRDSIYNLSTKYNVPLIGGAKLNTSYLTKDFPQEYRPLGHISTMGLDFMHLAKDSALVKDDDINFQSNMRVFAYDIETYTPDGPKSDPLKKENEIFCIGIGIFALGRQDPIENLCIVSKDFDKLPDLEHEEKTTFNRKSYVIHNEYKSDKPNDVATYIICENEEDLLKCYCDVLDKYNPQIITGFNTYGFDDRFMYKRCLYHNLTDRYLKCFSYYDLDEMSDVSWYKQFAPSYSEGIALKIDNRMRTDNATIQSWNVMCADVYKIMLKEDTKRFTQQGYGNLNTMLNVYKVVNPFDGKPLSKTEMSINDMFDNWKNGTNIYEIALYCRQDAWIAGTLIIKRAKFGDMIELANISSTSFRDSLFKADGMRVNMTIIAEAYSQGFALKDEKSDERMKLIEGKEGVIELGGKHFDPRTIVGGAVRNLHPGLNTFVEALDFSSMYPSQKESNMADSSSRVDDDIIKNPEKHGLKLVNTVEIEDMYGKRKIYYFKKLETVEKDYD